jgi:hypothetical protein
VNAADLVAAFDLPAAARLDRRVPKKLLIENGAPTAADRRSINESIEELIWVAALKPTTIAVPAYVDEIRDYLEIAVLRLTMRPHAKAARLTRLVHRAIPYPALLVIEDGDRIGISTAHKRRSLGEVGKVVMDDDGVAVQLDETTDATWLPAFLDALGLGRQPRTSMYSLYQGWMDTLVALTAARVTGAFVVLASRTDADARRQATAEYASAEAETGRLRTVAARETQLPRQVELNQQLARLRAARAQARAKL